MNKQFPFKNFFTMYSSLPLQTAIAFYCILPHAHQLYNDHSLKLSSSEKKVNKIKIPAVIKAPQRIERKTQRIVVLEGGVGLNVGFQVDIIVIVFFFLQQKSRLPKHSIVCFWDSLRVGFFLRGMRSFYCGITAWFYVGRTIVGEWTFLCNLAKKEIV